jgi:hypothetical protein
VLIAKVAAGAVVGALLAFAAGVATLAVGIPWLEVRGGSITTTIPRVAEWVGLLMVMGALWSTMGAIGLAVGHQAATIVGALVWVLFAEALVGAVAGDGVRKLLPASAGRAIAIQEPALLDPTTGAPALVLWTLAALCVGALHRKAPVSAALPDGRSRSRRSVLFAVPRGETATNGEQNGGRRDGMSRGRVRGCNSCADDRRLLAPFGCRSFPTVRRPRRSAGGR